MFKFLKDEGQKSLEGGTALVAIGIVLAPKYPLAAEVSAVPPPRPNVLSISLLTTHSLRLVQFVAYGEVSIALSLHIE